MSLNCSIKKGIHHAQLHAKHVASGPILSLLLSIKPFDSHTQFLSELPDEIQAGVMCFVIGIGSLRWFVIELHVAVSGRRSERIRPMVSIADCRAKGGNCL